MTFAQTSQLIKAINNLEVWSRSLEHEMNNDKTDWDVVNRYQDYIDGAKQEIFDMVEKGV